MVQTHLNVDGRVSVFIVVVTGAFANSSGYPHHDGVRRNVFNYDSVCTNLRVVAHGYWAQNPGSGAQHHSVADCGVAFAARHAAPTERYPVVKQHIIAHFGGLPDHDAHTVIDEDSLPQLGGGGNFDCRTGAVGMSKR